MFWVGEPADAANAFISNTQSYWDKDWLANFGGVDDPSIAERPLAGGLHAQGEPVLRGAALRRVHRATAASRTRPEVPWYRPGLAPLLKNRWVEIRHNVRVCFAQWQDVGPCGEDDFAFVFGASLVPLNTFDAKAGLDVSPAVWHHLGMTRERADRLALRR